jgi:hypothetical protein
MLKPQDIVVLLKLLAHPDHLDWPQHQLATQLCLSASAINASLARLNESGLLNLGITDKRYQPVIAACEELLIYSVKYFFPGTLGEYTRGIVTSYAAPTFKKRIVIGNTPVPIWPHAEGNQLGVALEPLYPSVPKSIMKHPDQLFYDLLVLVDAIRSGRARERSLAIKLLREKLGNETHLAN